MRVDRHGMYGLTHLMSGHPLLTSWRVTKTRIMRMIFTMNYTHGQCSPTWPEPVLKITGLLKNFSFYIGLLPQLIDVNSRTVCCGWDSLSHIFLKLTTSRAFLDQCK